MKGLDLWATSNEVPSLIKTALSDPYVSIRDDAISRTQSVSTDLQVQMLEEYSRREQERAYATDTERDAAKWLKDRVVGKLNALRAVVPPDSSSEK